MTKLEQAEKLLYAAAKAGKTVEQAAAEIKQALNVGVFCEPPLTPNTAGKAYYDSHNRTQKCALFELFAINLKTGKWGRNLGRTFIGGFEAAHAAQEGK